MRKIVLALCLTSYFYSCHASTTYDNFNETMNNWASDASGAEKTRREKIVTGLDQVMAAHNFHDNGSSFSSFQHFLQKPYKPNLRDIYFVLSLAAQEGISQGDLSKICTAAQISPIPADSLDLIFCGLFDRINNGNLSQLDIELFQSEISWLTGNNSTKITIDDFLTIVESDPDKDCDSIFNNLDANGVQALQEVIKAAVPAWTPPTLGYDSFDKNLTAWIASKYTDAASQAVAHQEIAAQILHTMHTKFQNQVPFSEFQQELLQTNSLWGGPALYFSLSKVASVPDNLPVPTDALEAIFRSAGLDIYACQPNEIDRIYTGLLSHQNGGTAGSQLSDEDIAQYANIVQYILTQGKTVDDVKTYITSILNDVSEFAQQDLMAIMNPESDPRPYNYAEDTEYFRNAQKILPLHPEDAQYYREHVIPSLGVGRYLSADSVGRYRYVSGKGGELYITVHYNQFLRADALMNAVKAHGQLTLEDIDSWINASTSADSHFYVEIEDLTQIAGVMAIDLLNLSTLDPAKLATVLSQISSVFLTINANPPPVIN